MIALLSLLLMSLWVGARVPNAAMPNRLNLNANSKTVWHILGICHVPTLTLWAVPILVGMVKKIWALRSLKLYLERSVNHYRQYTFIAFNSDILLCC